MSDGLLDSQKTSNVIALAGLGVAIVACCLAAVVVPEVRQWIGLAAELGGSPSPTGVPTAVPIRWPTQMPSPTGLAAPSAETPTGISMPTSMVVPPTETPISTPVQPTDTAMPTHVPTSTPVPTLAPGDIWTRPADGMVMVYVPAGEFEMGSTDGASDEQPVHTVALDAYWIDRTEVTNEQYGKCVAAGACDSPWESGSSTRDSYYGNTAYADYPVIYVSWHDAEDYCKWAGGRLPSEAEWEYAARGQKGREFPWGDVFDGTLLNYCDANCRFDYKDSEHDDGYADTAPVGSYPGGASWIGAQDMAGNVWEWAADWYDEDYYGESSSENPVGPSSGEYRVVREDSWFIDLLNVRAATRTWFSPGVSLDSIGFRCARGSE